MKKIELTYREIMFIGKVLSALPLDGKLGFARRRFLRNLNTHFVEFEAEKEELQQKYSEKDGEGNAKVFEGEIVFTKKNRMEFDKKWNELNDAKVVIDITPANESDFQVVGGLLAEEMEKTGKKNDGKMNAVDFDYYANLTEIVNAMIPVEVK